MPMSPIHSRTAPVVLLLIIAFAACHQSEDETKNPSPMSVFSFPLAHFATKASFAGEQALPLELGEKKSLRGALSLLERILPKKDPRRPILRTTPIRFVESHGRTDVAARWDPKNSCIEIGRIGLKDQLKLVVVLGHEFTHALHEEETPKDILTLLRSEVRAYESELAVVRRLKPVINDLDFTSPRERDFFQLSLTRHKRSGLLLLRMTRFRIALIALAFNMSQIRDQVEVAGVSSQNIQFIKGCEMQLAQVCLADRPITSQDAQSVDSVLTRFRLYLTKNSTFRGAGVDTILSEIDKNRGELIEIGESSRALAATETRLRKFRIVSTR